MTYHEGILHNLKPYVGSDHVLIGNGDFLQITHTGDTTIGSGSSCIKLSNVLLVPDLEKNLLSISQLTMDYPINCEFSNDYL